MADELLNMRLLPWCKVTYECAVVIDDMEVKRESNIS